MTTNVYQKLWLLWVVLGLPFTATYAQQNYFEPASSAQMRVAAPQEIEKFALYQLKVAELRTYLAKAPLEFQPNSTPLRLEIPLPNGSVEPFAIRESPVLAPAVAAAHPNIKTYTGIGQTHTAYTIRLSFTESGFDAIILGVEGDAVYYTKATAEPSARLYYTYFARDVKKNDLAKPFGAIGKCGSLAPTVKALPDINRKQARLGSALNNTGATLRTFRLAMAATGEFVQVKGGGNVATAFNTLVAYVNRLNAVYRVELSVALLLVSDTNLVYANAGTDPYTNADQEKMLEENQLNVTTVIGTANYDVGHVLGTAVGSGGGIAASPAVCNVNTKAAGVSGIGDGSFPPVFDDQLIQHEIGHQFGMSHTYNSAIPVCTTREPSTSVEPGSGATIMSYGFTCEDENGNDNYEVPQYMPFLNFHTVSYDQANAYINQLTCFSTTATNNAVPVINSFPSSTTIPKSTPFALTGTATDINAGDVLSYSWEGTNIGTVQPDASTLSNTALPPFFRSYLPAATGTRVFPRLSAVLDGSNYARGDKLPSVSIATTHRLTVRDNMGGVTYQTVTITVDGNSGPFLETTNLSGSYAANSIQTITWNVANTTALPVNCTGVNILLSTDGGQTFPTVLATNTPNDGSEPIRLPVVSTSSARIKIVSSNNIFFDISNRNFAIVVPAQVVVFTTQPPSQSLVCVGASVGISVSAIGGGPVTYQWYKNSTANPLAGQTSRILSFSNVQTTDAGTYFCVATDTFTTATSNSFTLQINTMFSLINGTWSDPSVWSCGRVPTPSDVVTVNHIVTLPPVYLAQGGLIRYGPGGRLVWLTGGRLRIGP